MPGRDATASCSSLPQPDGPVYVGLTDEPVDGDVPDVPEPTEAEIDFLLDVVSAALARPLTRADVVGAYAGLRPLLDAADGRTADLSRRHAVLTSPTGVVTVVGGKLTTYRRMAEDAVDAAVARAGLDAPARAAPRDLPLAGAASRDRAGAAARRAVAAAGPPLRRRRRAGPRRRARGHRADRRRAARPGRRRACRSRWPSCVFGVTHEGAPTSTTCSTGVPASGWCRATECSPSRRLAARSTLAKATLR